MTPTLPNPFMFDEPFDAEAFMEALEEVIAPPEDDIAIILENLDRIAA